ncbi:MAG TPA: hypothetical protein VLN25_10495 [Burkholderiaceae bacterium]|nr:hypothetical protein [Burkholderiaceae bacterium]
MDPILIAAVVFAFTFGGSLLGMWLRWKLPEHHLSDATKDTVKLGIGMVATMTALVLGLVTASAKNSFDSVDSAVKHTAIDLLTLDRLLARYGPEAAPMRAALKATVGRKIEQVWPRDASKPVQVDPVQSGTAVEGLVEGIRALSPRDDAQRRLQSRALDLGESLLTARWLAVADQSTSIPFAFLVVLLFWLMIIFASFGLFAPRNATVVVVLVLCALSVAGAVFLVLEMDRPLEGLIKVSPDPLRYAFAKLNT